MTTTTASTVMAAPISKIGPSDLDLHSPGDSGVSSIPALRLHYNALWHFFTQLDPDLEDSVPPKKPDAR